MFGQEYALAVIGRAKFGGTLEHVGVLLPNNCVAHCAPCRGEHLSTSSEFSAGQRVRIVRHVPAARHRETLYRILQALRAPKSYDVFTNNCEVFVNRVTGEKPNSAQLQGVVALLALVAFLCLAAHDSREM